MGFGVCVFFVMFLVCENDTPHVYIHLYVLFATFLDSSKRTQRFTIKMIKPNLQPTIFLLFSSLRSLRLFDLSLSYAYM